MRSRAVLGVLSLLFIVGCGSNPNSPSNYAQVAGNWSGTLQATQPFSGNVIGAFVMNLTQAGGGVNGTYNVPTVNGFNGTVSGTATKNSFSGTFTFNAIATNGASCVGTFAVSGPAGNETMTWTSPTVASNCVNLPTNIVISVQRR